MREMAAVSLAPSEIPTTDETHSGLPWSGIRALMLAVLDDAIHNLSSSHRLVRAEAEHWISSGERRYVFSFVVICETLALEPSAVRRSLIDLLSRKVKPGRLLKRSRPNVRHRGAIQLARAGHHAA